MEARDLDFMLLMMGFCVAGMGFSLFISLTTPTRSPEADRSPVSRSKSSQAPEDPTAHPEAE